ncbi:MAG: DUF4388 domain-containing protein [Planctomycetota bacterium]
MSKTKLWSLQFTCRRLAREARSLGRALDPSGAAARELEQHLASAAQLISASMEQLGAAPPTGRAGGTLDVAQLAFGDNAWANQSPLCDYKAPEESPPSPDHHRALRCSGAFLATPDLVTFLCSMKKSGVLLVDTLDERFTVELEGGDIVHAHSDGAPEGERLGDVLVELGTMAQGDLDALLAEGIRGRFGGRLGARILERGLATAEELQTALETQIRRLFQRLFQAAPKDFVFWEGPCVWGEDRMRLNATKLLLDGARAFDESSRGLGVLDVDRAPAAEAPAAEAGDEAVAAHSAHPLSPTPQDTSAGAPKPMLAITTREPAPAVALTPDPAVAPAVAIATAGNRAAAARHAGAPVRTGA